LNKEFLPDERFQFFSFHSPKLISMFQSMFMEETHKEFDFFLNNIRKINLDDAGSPGVATFL
jgi:hypothetical protein